MSVSIVTLDDDNSQVLRLKTQDFASDEMEKAREASELLFEALKPHVPAAGLAAPQIGLSRSVFIYSYDRKPENLSVAINPSYEPVGDERIEGWEGCLSSVLCCDSYKVAQLPRFATIRARYLNEKGEMVLKVLEGFAAKVFQHECDHLEGVINIEHPEAKVREFSSRAELEQFQTEVVKADTAHYNKPTE